MSFLLGKVLAVFLTPLGFALAAGLSLIALAGFFRRNLIRSLLALLLAGLWMVSTPKFAAFALRTLETDFPAYSVRSSPSASVAIVLGGGAIAAGSDVPNPDFNDASDRLLFAFRLLRSGKVERILFLGRGNGFRPAGSPASGPMADVLRDLGIDRSAVSVENESRNTYENGLAIKRIRQRDKFTTALLITSATHMRRALQVLRKLEIDVIPVPVDQRAASVEKPLPLAFMPDTEALLNSSVAIKEWLGLWIYRLRGWT